MPALPRATARTACRRARALRSEDPRRRSARKRPRRFRTPRGPRVARDAVVRVSRSDLGPANRRGPGPANPPAAVHRPRIFYHYLDIVVRTYDTTHKTSPIPRDRRRIRAWLRRRSRLSPGCRQLSSCRGSVEALSSLLSRPCLSSLVEPVEADSMCRCVEFCRGLSSSRSVE